MTINIFIFLSSFFFGFLFFNILLAYSSIDSYSIEGLHIYKEEQNDSELNNQIKNPSNEKYQIEDLKDINDRLTQSEMNMSTFINTNTSISLSMSTIAGPMRKRKRERI